jgi:hypothetical protein
VGGVTTGAVSLAAWEAGGVTGRTGFFMKNVGTKKIAIISRTAQSVRLSMTRDSSLS